MTLETGRQKQKARKALGFSKTLCLDAIIRSKSTKKPKLLIIDDESLSERLRDALGLEGYLVDTSYSAKEGLKNIESNFYNIILPDMKLPDSDGIAVLEKSKALSPDTEVIIFTAYANMDTVLKEIDNTEHKLAEKEIRHLATFPKLNINPILEENLSGERTSKA